jgi:hypothetical protein
MHNPYTVYADGSGGRDERRKVSINIPVHQRRLVMLLHTCCTLVSCVANVAAMNNSLHSSCV